MKRYDRITIKLSYNDKEKLETFGSVTLYDDDEPIITVMYDNE